MKNLYHLISILDYALKQLGRKKMSNFMKPSTFILIILISGFLNMTSLLKDTLGVETQPALEVSSALIDFGEVVVNKQSTQILTLKNLGQAPLHINSVAAGRYFKAEYNCKTVDAGKSCDISLTFQPNVKQTLTEVLYINTNDPNSPNKVILMGTGVYSEIERKIRLSHKSLQFDHLPVNDSGYPVNVRLYNDSSVPVNIDAINIEGDPFTQRNTCDSSIEAYSSCTIEVTFTPQRFDAFQGKLMIQSNAGNGLLELPVSGTCVESLEEKEIASLEIKEIAGNSFVDMPVTMGHPFKKGDIPAGQTLKARLENNRELPLQVDHKAIHPDGSLRHAILSFILPSVSNDDTIKVKLFSTTQGAPKSPLQMANLAASYETNISLFIDDIEYTASTKDLLKKSPLKKWLSGPLCTEWQVSSPLTASDGSTHPHLYAYFNIRAYKGLKDVRTSVIIENNWTYVQRPRNFLYDIKISLNGVDVYEKEDLKHYHHARWRNVFWWDQSGVRTPESIFVKHNNHYLMKTGSLPYYDPELAGKISETAIQSMCNGFNKNDPMGSGLVSHLMNSASKGPLPRWSSAFLLSNDHRLKQLTLGHGDISGSWAIHYRDINTKLPVSIHDYPYISTNWNMNDMYNPHTGRNETPNHCHEGDSCSSHRWTSDSMAYLPYLLTGDYYYLEELQFRANYFLILQNPGYREHEQFYVKGIWALSDQAWALRTLGWTAMITPEDHPFKDYFLRCIYNNIDYFNQKYLSDTNKDKLGWVGPLRESGSEAIVRTDQDDYFTWAISNLHTLGFDDAEPLFKWKAGFPVARMSTDGYCWVFGALRKIVTASNRYDSSTYFTDISDAWLPTLSHFYGGETVSQLKELRCGGAKMAEIIGLSPGEMATKSSAIRVDSYDARMQIALAAAVDSGVPGSIAAWNRFISRSNKPDYAGKGRPNFAIVPAKIAYSDADIVVIQDESTPFVVENGQSYSYQIALGSKPKHDVVITLLCDDKELILNPPELTFTEDNFNVPQTIIVTAANDTKDEGNHTSVITHTLSSDDSAYADVSISDINIQIYDNNALPKLSFSSDQINFGGLYIGNTTSSQVVIINDGTVPVDIDSIAVEGEYFVSSHQCADRLYPQDNCTVALTFAPGNTGPLTGSLVINSNAQNSPHHILLKGSGAQTIIKVGPNERYQWAAQAARVAKDNDIIEIQAGLYKRDLVSWYANNLTIRGVPNENGERAHFHGDGSGAEGKAIWVIKGKNYVIENIEFSHCKVADKNGAGIRLEGTSLTLRNCYFHDNQMGILTANIKDLVDNGEVLFEGCEFARMGYGKGFTHNMYINPLKKFTIINSYTHHARNGHTIKTRARENHILYNRIMDEKSGHSSYLIDFSQGGKNIMIGNLVHQSQHAPNANMISHAAEKNEHQQQELYIVNNTFVNDHQSQSSNFIRLRKTTDPVLIANNLFVGKGPIIPDSDKPNANALQLISNVKLDNIDDAYFVNPSKFDYRIADAKSPVVNAGTKQAQSLMPGYQYAHPRKLIDRPQIDIIDVGAYEYDPNQTYEIEKEETEKATTFTISADQLDFNRRLVNDSCFSQVLVLANHGTAPVSIKPITIDGEDFTFTDQCGSQLSANEYCYVDISFAPTQAGERLATLTVQADNKPHEVALKGYGTLPNKIIRVGPTRRYKTPRDAAFIAYSGDIIEIDAGEYVNNVAKFSASNLTIRGVGGRAHMKVIDGAVSWGGKAIWVITGSNTVIENIEFSGCKVPDKNGAGIRLEGTNLILRNCYFHHNEMGILTIANNHECELLIEGCEFAHNGYGDGYSHNMYINQMKKFTLRNCYSHDSDVGHLVKSRAYENHILYNRLSDETEGNSSYVIDFSNGGKNYVIGNVLHQGKNTENPAMISHGAEGGFNNEEQLLYVIGNTFVNDLDKTSQFVRVRDKTDRVIIANNLLVGHGETIISGDQTNAVSLDLISNIHLSSEDAAFVNISQYNYQITKHSSAMNKGTFIAPTVDCLLMPYFQYQHPLSIQKRVMVQKPDVGAYEFVDESLSIDLSMPDDCEALLEQHHMATESISPDQPSGETSTEQVSGDGSTGQSSTTATSEQSSSLLSSVQDGSDIEKELVAFHVKSTSDNYQFDVPVSLGQVFKAGDVPKNRTISARLDNGSEIPIQLDKKAVHSDGSLRHGILSLSMPQMSAEETKRVQLFSAPEKSETSPTITLQDVLSTDFDAFISIALEGQLYEASAKDFLKKNTDQTKTKWLNGSIAAEWHVSAPMKDISGKEHPHLVSRFYVRAYRLPDSQTIDHIRVTVVIENNWSYVPDPRNLTYDVNISVGGQIYEKNDLTHYNHARWKKVFWWNRNQIPDQQPSVHISHDVRYLMATKAIPNYAPDAIGTISESALESMEKKWNSLTGFSMYYYEPMSPGFADPRRMYKDGAGWPDFGQLPTWTLQYLLSMDERAKRVTLGTGDMGGSFPLHYRDKATNLPFSIADHPMASTMHHTKCYDYHTGIIHRPAECKSGNCWPYCVGEGRKAGLGSMPSMAYVPYMVTGDFYYLEELQFWASYTMLKRNYAYRKYEKGIIDGGSFTRAWSIRTIGRAAYITPDDHPLKQFYNDRVLDNIDYYIRKYVIGQSNSIGYIEDMYSDPTISPGGDDNFTYTINHLWELGFEDAQPLLEWKARFAVNRMGDQEYCKVFASPWRIKMGEMLSSRATYYKTINEVFENTLISRYGSIKANELLSLQCNSNEMARALGIKQGEILGYTDPISYLAYLQVALAAAVDAGIPGAEEAFQAYMSRTNKINYISSGVHNNNIVPRKMVAPVDPPETSSDIIIVDNDDEGFTPKRGNWLESGTSGGYGQTTLYASSVFPRAEWKANLQKGEYDLYAWWTHHSSRSAKIPYQIEHAHGIDTVFVNQQLNGGKWMYLGRYNFDDGLAEVQVFTKERDITVSADAIKWQTPLINVVKSGELTVTEQAKANYTIVLEKAPQGNVEIKLHGDDSLSVVPDTLIFSSENFNIPQHVTIESTENVDYGKKIISHSVVTQDNTYMNQNVPDINIMVSTSKVESVSFSANRISFGTMNVNNVSEPDSVILTNSGNQAINILSIDTFGPGFSQSNVCGSNLNPGDNCEITVKFSPQKGEASIGDLIVRYAGEDNLQKTAGISLTGYNTCHTTEIIQVGPTRTYQSIGKAFEAAKWGSIIEIDAGEYVGDVGILQKSHVTIRGVGSGRPHLKAEGKSAEAKAIWVIKGHNTLIENIEFSGCKVADKNGAGIRQEGNHLTLRNCYFHHNEMGILTVNTPEFELYIDGCMFEKNGYGDGYSHNIYVGRLKKFTMINSYSRHSKVGHNVKSRAYENHILYNRIMDEAEGNSSYQIDLPNGGKNYVIGNIIQQGVNAPNSCMIEHGAEGTTNPEQELYVINNTFVNDKNTSGSVFVRVVGSNNTRIANNLFVGNGTVLDGTGTQTANLHLTDTDPLFVDRTHYNYNLVQGSPAIDQGDASILDNPLLNPQFEYLHSLKLTQRNISGKIDIGACEFSATPKTEFTKLETIVDENCDELPENTDQTPPVIKQLVNDTVPRQKKIWNWETDEPAKFRYTISQNASWTPAGTYHFTTAATQPEGNGTYYLHIQAKDMWGNESSVKTVSAILDNTPPKCQIAYSTTQQTNHDVTISLIADEEFTILNNNGSIEKTFAENGHFTFAVSDLAGNKTDVTGIVNNIDKTPPTATFNYSTQEPTNQDVIVTVVPDESVKITNNNRHFSKTFTENGAFAFEMVDNAGNTSTAIAEVFCIDKTPPEATFNYSTIDVTNGEVTAELMPNEQITILNNEGAFEKVFTDNGEFTFEFVDLAGNTATATAVVQWIDKTPFTEAEIVTVEINEISGQAQQNVPITFGQVFRKGDIPSGQTLGARLADGSEIPIQSIRKATHADGSLCHGIFSMILPTLSADESKRITLITAQRGIQGNEITLQDLFATNFDTQLTIDLSGKQYQLNAKSLLETLPENKWMSGPVATEWHVASPLKDLDGNEHPHLTARLYIRAYGGLNTNAIDSIRVSVVIENNWTYVPDPQNFTYNIKIHMGNEEVYAKENLIHFHHARWKKDFWYGIQPEVHIAHDIRYLMVTGAVPNYHPELIQNIPESTLASLANYWSQEKTYKASDGSEYHLKNDEPMAIGYINNGTRGHEFWPITRLNGQYLLSMDQRAKMTALKTADLAGSFAMHFRDKNTDRPVSIDDYPYCGIIWHRGCTYNPKAKRNEAPTACVNECTVPHSTSNKQPFTYVPYMVTGDYYYLEELHFWTNYTILRNSNPGYREYEKGIRPNEYTMLGSLGRTVFISPDDHPQKEYFRDKLQNNIDACHETYAVKQPNIVGAMTGSTVYGTTDDDLTWTLGSLVDMGFESARDALKFKSRFSVVRLGDGTDYCWVFASKWKFKNMSNSETIRDFYEANFNDGGLVCGSDEMAKRHKLKPGQIAGYSCAYCSVAKIQPAISTAVDAGIPGAEAAWGRYINRTEKPNYNSYPNFNLVPRTLGLMEVTKKSVDIEEDGQTATYQIKLITQPSEDVVISIITDDQLSTTPSILTFTHDNYADPQTVKVSAIDDSSFEEIHKSQITHSITSNDSRFHNKYLQPVEVNIHDNDYDYQVTIVDLGATESENTYGLNQWQTVVNQKYTNYRNIGPGGTTIVVGKNRDYDYRRIEGDEREFTVGERLSVSFYNGSSTKTLAFTPRLSFDDPDRMKSGTKGTWHNMNEISLPPQSSGTTYLYIDESTKGNYTFININPNYSIGKTLILDKLMLAGQGECEGLKPPMGLATSAIPEGEVFPETNAMPAGWQKCNGGQDWIVTDDAAYEGLYSIKSQSVPFYGAAGIFYTGQFKDGTIKFHYKVGDTGRNVFLLFMVDYKYYMLSGQKDWQSYDFPINKGTHTILFGYWQLEHPVNETIDAAWIDNLQMPLADDNSSIQSSRKRSRTRSQTMTIQSLLKAEALKRKLKEIESSKTAHEETKALTEMDRMQLQKIDDQDLVHGAADAEEKTMISVDSKGNSHIVWLEIVRGWLNYTMISPSGDVLIENTDITDSVDETVSFFIGVDLQDKVHISWKMNQKRSSVMIDPSKDDQDGSTMNPEAIVSSSVKD